MAGRTAVVLLVAGLRVASVSGAPEPSPVLTLADGSRVQGQYRKAKNGKATTEFLGIPYAEPPIGDLRFRTPLKKKRWPGILNATTPPNSCVQTKDDYFGDFFGADMWNANTPKSEDCLYLNVWVPGRIDPSKRLQVMIWVYGGGFWSGTSTLDVYDGKILSSEENVPSFLFPPLISRENMEVFGGKSEGVTIFGESAGAASVSMHVLSRKSAPYFHRAIMQVAEGVLSSAATAPWAMESRHTAIERVLLLSEACGCNVTIRDARPDKDAAMACLRAASADKLRSQEWITFEFCDFPWTPVVDGEFFVEDPKTSLERGNFKKSEIILGINFDEAMYFIVYGVESVFPKDEFFSKNEFVTSDAKYEEAALTLLPKKFAKNPAVRNAILFEYRDWELPGNALRRQQALDKMLGDYHFACSVNEFAHWYQAGGGSVYYYYFQQRASAQSWPAWMGVLHGYEINFIFGEPLNTQDWNYTPAEQALSRKFMRYWANFARSGNPNKNPDGGWMMDLWPAYTEAQEYAILRANSSATGYAPRRRQCAFWKKYIPKLFTATASLTEMEVRWKEGFKRWEEDYITDWAYHFQAYKRYQARRNDDICTNEP